MRKGNLMIDKEELRLSMLGTCPPLGEVLSADSTEPVPAPVETGVPAAVLVGLLANPKGPRLILTRRTPHLRIHAGQISFPGGRIEESDTGPEAAALREAFEEIGLPPAKVELMGCLPIHLTVSRFLVYPVVGWVEPPVDLGPDPREVEQIIQVPLSYVLDTSHYRREALVFEEIVHDFWVLDYEAQRIWGATAGILVSLARVLGVRSGWPVAEGC
jgi:8-oxo-dGTP pyrophosphatase MutT (NUDIX family)